jgi:hypothetical protein
MRLASPRARCRLERSDTKVGLADRTGLSLATCSSIVNEMVAAGEVHFLPEYYNRTRDAQALYAPVAIPQVDLGLQYRSAADIAAMFSHDLDAVGGLVTGSYAADAGGAAGPSFMDE